MTRPNIVVVDGHTLNPGDLDYGPLQKLGDLQVFEKSGPLLEARCHDAHVVLTNKEAFDAALLSRLRNLRLIVVTATGTDIIALQAARKRGVVVSNVPAYSTASVAQHVFALLLELNNRVSEHARATRDGRWSSSGHFSYRLGPIHELANKTFGIIGFGAIGRAVCEIASALGMHVLAAEQRSTPELAPRYPHVAWASIDEVFQRSDVLTLHCPLNEQTQGLVNRARLASMKPTALLLNTGRGALIDEEALAEALHAGLLAGAGLDVLSQEPPERDHPLLHAPRCLVTPHLAWASVEARQRLLSVSIENVRCFLEGHPQNVVN